MQYHRWDREFFLQREICLEGLLSFSTTIVDVSMVDQGEYFCKVYTLSGSDHVKVTEGSTNVEVYFLPNSIYPQCQSTPAVTENMNEQCAARIEVLIFRRSSCS